MSAADVVTALGRPLRVAVVGAGPAGFYAIEHLTKSEVEAEVDLIDRLPTPYGLVRGGVAPDHQKIKSVTKAYERIASAPGVRYYGLVEFGTHVTLEDLKRHYDVIILSVGAPHDRRMGIEGEELPGSISATDFVAWYNGHPDYRDLEVDLSVESAVVVGAGNVAIDVARILVTDPDDLATTDIADHALEALRASRIRHVTMLARRGPAQAAFTPKELRELGELSGVTFVVDPAALELDPETEAALDEDARRNLDALAPLVGRTPAEGDRILEFRFLVSPTALIGDSRVEEVAIVENELVRDGGSMRPRATDRTDTIPAGLVLRAVGYRGAPLDGVAFDERAGVVPHDGGRILDAPDGAVVTGLYTAGWIKRGPQGVIGTNKACAAETVRTLLDDIAEGRIAPASDPSAEAADALYRRRVERPVSWEDWIRINAAEIAQGEAEGRPRRKFVDVPSMLAVLDEA